MPRNFLKVILFFTVVLMVALGLTAVWTKSSVDADSGVVSVINNKCLDGTCENGNGACLTDDDCKDYHSECQSNKCVDVVGKGPACDKASCEGGKGTTCDYDDLEGWICVDSGDPKTSCDPAVCDGGSGTTCVSGACVDSGNSNTYCDPNICLSNGTICSGGKCVPSGDPKTSCNPVFCEGGSGSTCYDGECVDSGDPKTFCDPAVCGGGYGTTCKNGVCVDSGNSNTYCDPNICLSNGTICSGGKCVPSGDPKTSCNPAVCDGGSGTTCVSGACVDSGDPKTSCDPAACKKDKGSQCQNRKCVEVSNTALACDKASCEGGPGSTCDSTKKTCAPGSPGQTCDVYSCSGGPGSTCDSTKKTCVPGSPGQTCDPGACKNGKGSDCQNRKCVEVSNTALACNKPKCEGGPGTTCVNRACAPGSPGQTCDVDKCAAGKIDNIPSKDVCGFNSGGLPICVNVQCQAGETCDSECKSNSECAGKIDNIPSKDVCGFNSGGLPICVNVQCQAGETCNSECKSNSECAGKIDNIPSKGVCVFSNNKPVCAKVPCVPGQTCEDDCKSDSECAGKIKTIPTYGLCLLDSGKKPICVEFDCPAGKTCPKSECEDDSKCTSAKIENIQSKAICSLNQKKEPICVGVDCSPGEECTQQCEVDKDCVPKGILKIVKETSGEDGVFYFGTSTATDLFSVFTFEGYGERKIELYPDSYDLGEFFISNGWASGPGLAYCINQKGEEVGKNQKEDEVLNIPVLKDQTTTCVFQDSAYGNLRIVKTTEGEDDEFVYRVVLPGSTSTLSTDEGKDRILVKKTKGGEGRLENNEGLIIKTHDNKGSLDVYFKTGYYDIVEEPSYGWLVSYVACKDEDGNEVGQPEQNRQGNYTGVVYDLPLDLAKTTTCNFENILTPGILEIIKETGGSDVRSYVYEKGGELRSSLFFSYYLYDQWGVLPDYGNIEVFPGREINLGIGSGKIYLPPGDTYVITELFPQGWLPKEVYCEDEDGDEVGVPLVSHNVITEVPIESGRKTTCAFVNEFIRTGGGRSGETEFKEQERSPYLQPGL